MAVINSPQIGIARGKLGDAVYYRSKGNTNARGYNPNTTNRRTSSQQSQRSLFSSAVKFFSRGTQNLFVFAYEDKRTQESDYNAFMRYNAKRGIFFGPAQNDNPAYPALGKWVMTHGSLPNMDYEYDDGEFHINLRPAAGFSTIETVGQLSSLLMTSPEWLPGDIFTVVSIGSDAMPISPTEPVRVGTSEPYWAIKQFILDESDSTPLDAFGLEYVETESSAYLIATAEYPIPIVRIVGFAAIHSRTQLGKLRVSDSVLVFNRQGDEAISYGQTQSWRDIVLAAWGSEQPSILQGGLARREQYEPETTVTCSFELPAAVNTLNTQTIIVSGEHTADELITHLNFLFEEHGRLIPTYSNGFLYFTVGSDNIWSLKILSGPGFVILEGFSTTSEAVINSIFWA